MRLLLLACFALPVVAGAQSPTAAIGETRFGHKQPVPSATAVRRQSPIVLDGKLDEPAWRDAPPITELRQVDPEEGKPASERTDVRFLYDDDALYIGAKMYDSHGRDGVVTRLVRRDGNFDMDYFEVVIDSFHDHLSRAFFEVNPSGSKNESIGIGTSCCDPSWDPVWEASTRIDTDGWTAEIRIPFNQLRFSRDSIQTWGLQVRRFIKRRDEQDQWSWWGKTESGGPSRFGHLEGIRIGASRSSLELLPYALSKSQSLASEHGDPLVTRGRPTMRAGVDLKDRLTTNLTLDATINPDFGQVEVDPAVLNLSAFETFFPEKRPFFVEGAQVFDFGSFNCYFCSNVEGMSGFYSRRIGRAPTGSDLVSSYAFADVPDATTILGAGKITGRTSDGTTVGLLNAVTGQATARVQSTDGTRANREVEPLADYFVGRLKHDYFNGNLVVGGILSGVARNIDTTFAPRLARHAEMTGGDMVSTWHDHQYSFRANAALTNVTGDPRDILLRQESSARYFQRPDRGTGSRGLLSNQLDSSATSLRGAGAYARLAKEAGDWLWETAINTRTPGFESNDYAFQQRADYIWYNANVARQWTKPTSWYRQTLIIVGGQDQRNFEGDHTGLQLQQYWQETTPQFWNISSFHLYRAAAIDDRALRGGPAIETPANHYVSLNVSTDSRHRWVGSGNIGYYWDTQHGVGPSVGFEADYRPAPNMVISFAPGWSRSRNTPQYVTSVTDVAAASFFGTRYVMSHIDQRTLNLDTRLNITFSPTMTLELYAQPFFAAGRYLDFAEYASPRSQQLLVYGRDRGTVGMTRDAKTGLTSSYTIDPDGAGPAQAFTFDNPNFSQQSLRGNAVFRWEYRPGSVLYVAWTHSRFDQSPFGNLEFTRDREALFAAPPDNIFLVKASWWLTR